MSSNDRPAPDPRYSGLYQRGGDSAVEPDGHHDAPPSFAPLPSQGPGPSSHPTSARTTPQREDTAPIREIGADDSQEVPPTPVRNPFDAWIWGLAAALLALGVFLLLAPTLYAETIQEQAASGFFFGHWTQQSGTAAAPLLLVGSATAVTQLFVLSHRRHRRTR